MDSSKIFLLIIGNIIHLILSLLFFYLLRVVFEIEIVGYYGTIISFLTAFSFINDLGIQLAFLKFFAESKNADEEAICNGTFLTYRFIQLLIYISTILICLPIAPMSDDGVMVFFLFFTGWIFLRVGFFEQILLSKKEVFKKSITSIFFVLIKNLSLLLVFFYFEKSALTLGYILLISTLSYFGLSSYIIRKRKFKKPSKASMLKFLRYSLPFFITSALVFITGNIDVLIINTWSSIENVANYFTAKQFFSYFLIITTNISSILITTFSKNIANSKNETNFAVINYTHKILNLIIIPIIFIFVLYGSNLFVFLFGIDYYLTGQILNGFLFLLIPLSLDVANLAYLQALGEVKFIAKFTIIENILSIIFMIIFISPILLNLDVFGGVLSYLLAKIITQIVYRPIIYKKFTLGFYWGSFRDLGIMGGIYLLQIIINIVFDYSIIFIPLFVILNISLYFALNYLFKGFSKQDFRFILNTINIRNLYNTASSELEDKN